MYTLSEEFEDLRRRLVNAYVGATYDAEEAGYATARLRELLVEMNSISQEKVDYLRACFEAGYGVREAARRAFVSRGTALNYYHEFRLEARTSSKTLNLGEPTPGRSALDGFKAWTPTYDDKPIMVTQPKAAEPEPKAAPQKIIVNKWGNPIPSSDDVALALVLASQVTNVDPARVATGERSQIKAESNSLSRARNYAGLALREVFPGMATPMIAKLIGVTNQNSRSTYFAVIDYRMKRGDTPWYDPEITKTIVAALRGQRASLSQGVHSS